VIDFTESVLFYRGAVGGAAMIALPCHAVTDAERLFGLILPQRIGETSERQANLLWAAAYEVCFARSDNFQ
jgi:hypothetical protein